MNEIIPFGKYKNQPIEVLAYDKKYTDWLCQQNWFINQFSPLHTIIINNFNQPSDTPEHNKLVANFFDDGFCKILAKKFHHWDILPIITRQIKTYNDLINRAKMYNESSEYYMKWSSDNESTIEAIQSRNEEINGYEKIIDDLQNNKFHVDIEISERTYENNFDVGFSYSRYLILDNVDNKIMISGNFIRVECKPIVSEDYPAILRQCKNQKANVLLIERYTAETINIEQLKKMYGEIQVFMLNELI